MILILLSIDTLSYWEQILLWLLLGQITRTSLLLLLIWSLKVDCWRFRSNWAPYQRIFFDNHWNLRLLFPSRWLFIPAANHRIRLLWSSGSNTMSLVCSDTPIAYRIDLVLVLQMTLNTPSLDILPSALGKPAGCNEIVPIVVESRGRFSDFAQLVFVVEYRV